MKFGWAIVIPFALLSGCARNSDSTGFAPVPGPSRTVATLPAPPVNEPPTKTNAPPVKPPIVTPDNSVTGKVVKFNETTRIVVLEFPLINMPGPDRTLFLYRNDLKVGEIKTSRWQRDQLIVADLIAGEAQAGDVVRDR